MKTAALWSLGIGASLLTVVIPYLVYLSPGSTGPARRFRPSGRSFIALCIAWGAMMLVAFSISPEEPKGYRLWLESLALVNIVASVVLHWIARPRGTTNETAGHGSVPPSMPPN